MTKPLTASFLFRLYGLLWRVALPVVWLCAKRLRQGWDERVLRGFAHEPADLWIQAASVGEAFLTIEILKGLGQSVKVLATTNTSQGRDVLENGRETLPETVDLRVAYFPLDAPHLVRKALGQVQPRTAVLLESEMWPAFMAGCRDTGTELLLVNGRMSEGSLKNYLRCKNLFRAIGPHHVLAMSDDDHRRFATLYGEDRAGRMHNIKFDRIAPVSSGTDNPLAPLLPADAPFVMLASVRKEEEGDILEIIKELKFACKNVVIGLFPRHMERVDAWRAVFCGLNMAYCTRTELTGPVQPGSVVLWDTIGEMGHGFGLASAAFVGGSLARLGGQNFLEPLAAGLVPVIGPHWKNFAWVGRGIVDAGLVDEQPDRAGVLKALQERVDTAPDRDTIRTRFTAYIEPRRGGTVQARDLITQSLSREEKP